jgi:hypothetical protein
LDYYWSRSIAKDKYWSVKPSFIAETIFGGAKNGRFCVNYHAHSEHPQLILQSDFGHETHIKDPSILYLLKKAYGKYSTKRALEHNREAYITKNCHVCEYFHWQFDKI